MINMLGMKHYTFEIISMLFCYFNILSDIAILDEKLTRYKEVEELYDEIMKSVHKSHLDADEGKLT